MFTLTSIHIYPVKSLGGIALDVALVQSRGLQYDRRWMLVDDEGLFVSQREIPQMALLDTAIKAPNLVVFARKNPSLRLEIPLIPFGVELTEITVRVWDDHCPALLFPAPWNQWFSKVLGQSLRLVYMPDEFHRPADERYAPAGQPVSFADAYPILLLGQASLDDLNNRMARPIPMNRFRPNLVFTGGAPFEEDGWLDFELGSVPFRCVKPCARCILTTTDQDTAERAAEPLKTLATFRKQENKILFGQNVVWSGGVNPASVRVGDALLPRYQE